MLLTFELVQHEQAFHHALAQHALPSGQIDSDGVLLDFIREDEGIDQQEDIQQEKKPDDGQQ